MVEIIELDNSDSASSSSSLSSTSLQIVHDRIRKKYKSSDHDAALHGLDNVDTERSMNQTVKGNNHVDTRINNYNSTSSYSTTIEENGSICKGKSMSTLNLQNTNNQAPNKSDTNYQTGSEKGLNEHSVVQTSPLAKTINIQTESLNKNQEESKLSSNASIQTQSRLSPVFICKTLGGTNFSSNGLSSEQPLKCNQQTSHHHLNGNNNQLRLPERNRSNTKKNGGIVSGEEESHHKLSTCSNSPSPISDNTSFSKDETALSSTPLLTMQISKSDSNSSTFIEEPYGPGDELSPNKNLRMLNMNKSYGQIGSDHRGNFSKSTSSSIDPKIPLKQSRNKIDEDQQASPCVALQSLSQKYSSGNQLNPYAIKKLTKNANKDVESESLLSTITSGATNKLIQQHSSIQRKLHNGKNLSQNDTIENKNTEKQSVRTVATKKNNILKLEDKTDKKQQSCPLIDPTVYQPRTFQGKTNPIIHQLNKRNRPVHKRRMEHVSKVFKPPISNFWKAKFHSFNHLQSEITQPLVFSSDNMVVSAPTGAGKTCIFEMAIGKLFDLESNDFLMKNYQCQQEHYHQKPSNSRKIVYIAPSKALCEERYNDWKRRLSDVDPSIECALITSDGGDSLRRVASAHLIITTPEKWDSITRKWTDHLSLIGAVKLLLIDEVHFIGDESRGACLEAIICRMKTVQRATAISTRDYVANASSTTSASLSKSNKMRIVAVSATLPNIDDIASFLEANEAYVFDTSYRPVPLTTHVVGLGYVGKNQFIFERNLNRHVPSLLNRFSEQKPSIVFCHTKQQTEILASELSISYGTENTSPVLSNMAKQTSLPSLRKCLNNKIAYHHAGMDLDNRRIVEGAFSKGLIKCLCATSTLAMGVNLPTHLVIIKGTSVWRGGGNGYQAIDTGSLLQMIGRAGRPGFDTTGTAVVMTDGASKKKYEKMTGGLEAVESILLKKLVETLNTEVCQHVIANVQHAIDWLKGTFFYTRVRKNTRRYGLLGKSDEEIDAYLMRHVCESLQQLHTTSIINLTDGGKSIGPRKASHVMSQHMVPFEEMKAIIALPHDSGPLQLLQMLSKCNGLHTPVRKSEKKILNDAQKLIKFKLEGPPSKIRIQQPSQKAFVLLQCAIGQIRLDDYTLRQEMSRVIEYSSRILKAAEDYSVEESKHGKVALESLLLRRSLVCSLWGPNDGVLNQLSGVGQKTARKLSVNNIKTFADILSKSSNEIEQACGRVSPFGQQLRGAAMKILSRSLSLTAQIEGLDNYQTSNMLVCSLRSRNEIYSTQSDENGSRIVTYTLSVHTDRPHGCLMFRSEVVGAGTHSIQCPAKFGRLYVRLVSNLVGLDEQLMIDGNDEIVKSKMILTPNAKVSMQQKGSSKKRSKNNDSENLSILNHMVEGISDPRVHRSTNIEGKNTVASSRKRSKITNSVGIKNPTNEIESSANDGEHHKNTVIESTPRNQQVLVTPSPSGLMRARSNHSLNTQFEHSNSKQKRLCPAPNSIQARHQGRFNDVQSTGTSHSSGISNNHTTPKPKSRLLWKKEKMEQNAFQRRAFGSKKDNPFSSFKYDPNSIESQLEIQSKMNTFGEERVGDIIPPSAATRSLGQQQFKPKSRFLTPQKGGFSPFSIGSMRRKRVGTTNSRYSNQELLRQKAEEQQAYVMTSTRESLSSRISKATHDDMSCHIAPSYKLDSNYGIKENFDPDSRLNQGGGEIDYISQEEQGSRNYQHNRTNCSLPDYEYGFLSTTGMHPDSHTESAKMNKPSLSQKILQKFRPLSRENGFGERSCTRNNNDLTASLYGDHLTSRVLEEINHENVGKCDEAVNTLLSQVYNDHDDTALSLSDEIRQSDQLNIARRFSMGQDVPLSSMNSLPGQKIAQMTSNDKVLYSNEEPLLDMADHLSQPQFLQTNDRACLESNACFGTCRRSNRYHQVQANDSTSNQDFTNATVAENGEYHERSIVSQNKMENLPNRSGTFDEGSDALFESAFF